MLRTFALCLGLALAVTVGTAPKAQSDTVIQGVIQSQIDAFQVDDFATAFTFASPMIKRIFGSPERFGQMVRSGYPMVWRPSSVRFLDLREERGALWQKVLVEDGAGALHVLDYQMIQTEAGWQINGVNLLAKPQVGA